MVNSKVIPFRQSDLPEFDEILDTFIYFKKAEGCANSTIKDYRRFCLLFHSRFPYVYGNESKTRSAILKHLGSYENPATYNFHLKICRG